MKKTKTTKPFMVLVFLSVLTLLNTVSYASENKCGGIFLTDNEIQRALTLKKLEQTYKANLATAIDNMQKLQIPEEIVTLDLKYDLQKAVGILNFFRTLKFKAYKFFKRNAAEKKDADLHDILILGSTSNHLKFAIEAANNGAKVALSINFSQYEINQIATNDEYQSRRLWNVQGPIATGNFFLMKKLPHMTGLNDAEKNVFNSLVKQGRIVVFGSPANSNSFRILDQTISIGPDTYYRYQVNMGYPVESYILDVNIVVR